MKNELISLTRWPSMPAPWSSSTPGEAWIWGDYVLIFQTKPGTVSDLMSNITGKKSSENIPLEYPFAMTVFFRKDRNPHGPSSRPILVATLEKMDYSATAKMMGISAENLSGKSNVVQGLFTAEIRSNLGDFQGNLTVSSARSYFLNLMQQRLSLEGEPTKIGVIDDVFGHPETGWPAKEKTKSAGCLSVILTFILFIAPVLVWLFIK